MSEENDKTGESESTPRPKLSKRVRLWRLLRGNWPWVIAIVIVGSTAILAIAELWARSYLKDTWQFTRQDPELGWSHKPSAVSNSIFADGDWGLTKQEIRINSKGLRDDEEIPYEKPAGVRRILVLGDSFVEAAQVPLKTTFVKQLEARLNERHGAQSHQALIAGHGNWGTDQQYLMYLKEGRKYSPDIVVIVMFPSNDFLDSDPALNDRAYHPKFFFDVDAEGNLEKSEQTFVPPLALELQSNKNAFQKVAGRLQIYHLTRLYVGCHHSSLDRFLTRIGVFAPPCKFTDEGYPLPIEILRVPLPERWNKAIARCEALLTELKREVESDGAVLRGVIIPMHVVRKANYPERMNPWMGGLKDEEMDRDQPERLAREIFERLDIPALDLTDPLLEALEETGKPTMIWPDNHFNEYGHEVVTEALMEFLDDLCPPPPNPESSTENQP